ncbi:MAG: hypothetical protein J5930_06330 [Treponema sp.]|nr:hypothetical protein [Treponema sp.]MBO5607497.1 hypothetical protein [Treponema sp.]
MKTKLFRRLFFVTLIAFFTPALFAENTGKSLIVYFTLYGNQQRQPTDADTGASRTVYKGNVYGNTETLAVMLKEFIKADTLKISTSKKYGRSLSEVKTEVQKEFQQDGNVSITAKVDLSAYDTVYLGFPVWEDKIPKAVETFLAENDLSEKKVFMFTTGTPQSMGAHLDTLRKSITSCKVNANVFYTQGDRAINARAKLTRWLKDNRLM